MSEQRRYPHEKDEKADEMTEKADEKTEEKTEEKMHEKSWDEKWQRDPLSIIVWSSILIWAGLVLFAGNLGWLRGLALPEGLGVFSLIFIGAGLIILVEALMRALVPAYSRPIMGTLIFAFILLGVGLGGFIGWPIIGAAVLIAIGLSMLLRGLRPRR
jgi:hypothetical protein